jgi:hypothetical protein
MPIIIPNPFLSKFMSASEKCCMDS